MSRGKYWLILWQLSSGWVADLCSVFLYGTRVRVLILRLRGLIPYCLYLQYQYYLWTPQSFLLGTNAIIHLPPTGIKIFTTIKHKTLKTELKMRLSLHLFTTFSLLVVPLTNSSGCPFGSLEAGGGACGKAAALRQQKLHRSRGTNASSSTERWHSPFSLEEIETGKTIHCSLDNRRGYHRYYYPALTNMALTIKQLVY